MQLSQKQAWQASIRMQVYTYFFTCSILSTSDGYFIYHHDLCFGLIKNCEMYMYMCTCVIVYVCGKICLMCRTPACFHLRPCITAQASSFTLPSYTSCVIATPSLYPLPLCPVLYCSTQCHFVSLPKLLIIDEQRYRDALSR